MGIDETNRATNYIRNWQERGVISSDRVVTAILETELTIALEAMRIRTLRECATHLREAMNDVERLSPDYTHSLSVFDVRRLADELVSFQ